MNMLRKIIEHKKTEIENKKRQVPAGKLEALLLSGPGSVSLKDSLSDPGKKGIIAEFKRRSPSKGVINDTADPGTVAAGYYINGASGVSVLTDQKFFGGSTDDLTSARISCGAPLLMKDFILDEYQIIEARAAGADLILLIAAVLSKKRVEELARFARLSGLQVILEVRSADELSVISDNIDIVGVNNRNLDTFTVDVSASVKIAHDIPKDFIRISESGLSSPDIVKKLKDLGYNGFLMGELFMKTNDPVIAFKKFINLI
jgi:indole-3-glycerol phosphate synthase